MSVGRYPYTGRKGVGPPIPVGVLLAGISCLILPPALSGQTPTEPSHWCFRGRPSPACNVFWLTEAGVAAHVAGNQAAYESAPLFTWELGWMVNRGSSRAFGIAAFGQAGDGMVAAGIRPRVRFWMNPTMSLDVAPGVAVYASDGGGPGFSGHVGLNFGDYGAATVHVVALRPRTYDTNRSMRTAVFAGGRLGSVPGTVVGVGGPVVVLAILLIACSSGGCYD